MWNQKRVLKYWKKETETKWEKKVLIIKLRKQQDCTDSAKYSDGKFERVLHKFERENKFMKSKSHLKETKMPIMTYFLHNG